MKKLFLISLLLLSNLSFSQPYESTWIEQLYGMPENLSDLKLKFEMFGETPNFVISIR